MTEQYDLIVVGGGPAGYVSAIKAAQLGAKVALIEKDTVGGTCLNRGCIPTKTYLKNTEIIHQIHKAKERGIILGNSAFQIDMPAVVKMKDTVVSKLTGGVAALLKSNGVALYSGLGVLKSSSEVSIGGKTTLSASKIILAGGSKTFRLPIPGVDLPAIMTSDEILNLKEIPERLVIVGGGVIGIEMAFIFQSFGSQVSIVELEDRLLPFMDEDISREIAKTLKELKIQTRLGVKLERFEDKKGKVLVHLSDKQVIESDAVLLSIGRVPDTEVCGELKFEMAGKYLKVDDHMATNINGIYAPGDINGRKMLAHAAFKMGEIAAINALGGHEKFDGSFVPSIVYCLPEIASVGLTEKQARASHEIQVGKFSLAANGRALASGETQGFIKVVIDKQFHEILGVHMIGAMSSEMINEVASLMAMEICADEVAGIIHGHPTISEAFMEAVADSLGHCIHLPPKKK